MRSSAMMSVVLVIVILAGCTPAFEKGAKTQEEFDRDNGQCLDENTRKTAVRYGSNRRTDWNSYAKCMSSKGYLRK
jgi:hypothetical protein